MACAIEQNAMRCCRRESASAGSAQRAMPCHHAMAEAPQPASSEIASSETSVAAAQSKDCCQNRCCCGATTSEWAQPASSLLSVLSLPIEPARLAYNWEVQAADIFGLDSARAPPRS
jgi:hypothetical protein